MRPINLIPESERRSHGSTTRTGPLAYVIVGALAALLVGVVMLVLASNQISEREGEVETLEARKAAATARAEELAPYASFEQVAVQRTQTVASLADGRFDWVRVIRQLSLILPPRVYLETLTGSAGGGGESEGSSGGVAGPSLSLKGCAPGQDAVAGFVAALKEIDGVTRVGLNSSGFSEGSSTGASVCAVGRKAQFEILVAFDAAPPSPDSPEAVAAPVETGEAEGGEAEGEPSEAASEGDEASAAEPSTGTAG